MQVEWEGAAESPEERKQQLEDSPQGVISAVLRCQLTSSWCSTYVMHSCQVAACLRSGPRKRLRMFQDSPTPDGYCDFEDSIAFSE